MLEDVALWFIALGVATFLVAGIWAPFETLAWWAGHHARSRHGPTPPSEDHRHPIQHFVVYLGGIDSIDGTEHTDYERPFLDALSRAFEAGAVQTVFPYAANGEPLLRGPRVFRWIWRRLRELPGRKRPLLAYLINARNAFQVLVAADRRYGPIFSQALAQLIVDALMAWGWDESAAQRLTLIGYSGGAQMAIGAAAHLASRCKGGIGVISIGGTILSSAALDFIDRLDHLTGSSDIAARLTGLMCSSRWLITVNSSWRRAEIDGRLTRLDLGPIAHTGSEGYFGQASHAGRSNLEATLSATLACLSRPVETRAPRSRRVLPLGPDLP